MAEPASDEPQGYESGRLDAFVDAAFAFAVTLLVIAGGAPPTTFDELMGALAHIPAYAASFALLVVFWAAHREYGRLTPRRDGFGVAMSLAVVLVVLIYVYPLRLITGASMRYLSGGRLISGPPLRSFQDLSALYTVFGVGFVTLALLIAALFLHTARSARLAPDPAVRRAAALGAVDWFIVAGAGVVSCLLAQTVPLSVAPWAPGFAYWLIPAAIGARIWLTRQRNRA